MPSVNFINWRQRQTERALLSLVASSFLVCMFGILIVSLLAKFVADKIQFQGLRNDYLVSKMNDLEGNVKAISGVRDHKRELEKKLQIVSLLQVSRHSVPTVLNELVTVIPEQVVLERIDMDGKNITVKGYSLSKTGVADFIRNISGSTVLREERIDQLTVNSEQKQPEHSQFSLHFSYFEGTKSEHVKTTAE